MMLDLEIPYNFFPRDLARYLPYIRNSYEADNASFSSEQGRFHKKCVHGMGIFSIEEIQPDQELFLDYGNQYFQGQSKPDWLLQAGEVKIAKYLQKKQIVHDLGPIHKFLTRWELFRLDAFETLEWNRERRQEVDSKLKDQLQDQHQKRFDAFREKFDIKYKQEKHDTKQMDSENDSNKINEKENK